MKRNSRRHTSDLVKALKIDLSEDEILADLQYPVAAERPVKVSVDDKRGQES